MSSLFKIFNGINAFLKKHHAYYCLFRPVKHFKVTGYRSVMLCEYSNRGSLSCEIIQ